MLIGTNNEKRNEIEDAIELDRLQEMFGVTPKTDGFDRDVIFQDEEYPLEDEDEVTAEYVRDYVREEQAKS